MKKKQQNLCRLPLHVLFVFFILWGALEAPSASHLVCGLALLVSAVSLWMLRPVKEWSAMEMWKAGFGSGLSVGAIVMATLCIFLSRSEIRQQSRQSAPNESSDPKNVWKQESLDNGALPSHQESRHKPCIEERSLSSDAETPKSQGVTCPCMRHTTIELLASCLNSCIESPFLWTFKVDQEGREDTERNIKAHVNRGKVDTAKWVSRLGEKTRVNIENIRSSLMGEDRR